MSKSDSPLPPKHTSSAEQGNILLYLPWEFDMLGGVDVVVDRLWKGLETTMPGRAIIGIQDWHVQGEKTDAEGRRFLHLNQPAPPAENGLAAWRYHLTLAKWLPRLLRTLRQHQITSVNVHFPTLNTYSLALLKHLGLWRGHLVLSFHGSDVNDIDATSPRWRLIANYTDAITACSGALAEQVDRLCLFHKPPLVIYNGIDCKRFAELAETVQPLPEAKPPYILNVGNYVPHKGQDVLLKAFARIAPFYNDLKLICVGGKNNGIWLQQLITLAQTIGIENRVIMLADQTQASVANLMKSATCLVHTSHTESFGLIVIEAGACSTPIIATNVGGIPEIITSEKFGLLASPGNDEEIAKLISKLIESSALAETNAKNFLALVRHKFSVEAMITSYANIIFSRTR